MSDERPRPGKGATKNPKSGGSVAVAALRMEALCAWAVERAEGVPRKLKCSIGDRFIEANLLVVERLVEAAYQRDKRAVLQAASRARVLDQRRYPITLTPIPPGLATTTLRSF